MIKGLIKIANELDRKGYREYASRLDSILDKNRKELSKFAGEEVPARDAMSHEDHLLSEEYYNEEYPEEYPEEHYGKSLSSEEEPSAAERVANFIAEGSPIFGLDPDSGERAEDNIRKDLVSLLGRGEHAKTVEAIIGLMDKYKFQKGE